MRDKFNALPESLAPTISFILDTTTVRTYIPSMGEGDFKKWGKDFFNKHKKMFGVKLEVAVALQRHPLPIFTDFAPAGMHDLTLARRGIFHAMRPGEIGIGDPGYGGHSLKIYAPPKRNEHLYVDELNKRELTLQRRVEMANRIIKRWNCLGSVYRKGALHAYADLELLCSLIPKIVFWDLLLNQHHSGVVHTTGPTSDKLPPQKHRVNIHRHQQVRLARSIGKKPLPKQFMQPYGVRRAGKSLTYRLTRNKA
jgi:hypothetical protein